HMENFAEIEREFSSAGALVRIDGASDLAGAIGALLTDKARAQRTGAKARDLAISKRGVAEGVARRINEALSEGAANPPRGLLARLALTPLTWIWSVGHRINVRRSLARQRKLGTRVISVGALTMGGAGKSPMVAHLAERLAAMGHNPAILTRGYRRQSHERAV